MLGEVLQPVTILLGVFIIMGIALAEIEFNQNNDNKKNMSRPKFNKSKLKKYTKKS